MDDERDGEPTELATEGDAAWRERTQDRTPDAKEDEIAPPPPAGIDPEDRHP